MDHGDCKTIVCQGESACRGTGLVMFFPSDHESEAIAAWNRRASPAPVNPQSVPDSMQKAAFAVVADGKIQHLCVYESQAETFTEAWNAGGMDSQAFTVPLLAGADVDLSATPRPRGES